MNKISMKESHTTTVEPVVSSVVDETTSLSELYRGCRVVDTQFDYWPWDNPDNIVSLEAQVNAYKLGGVLISLVTLLGVPLNVLNCMVFYRQGLRERVNLLLFSLGCADLVNTGYNFCLFVEYMYTLLVGQFRMDSTVMKVAVNAGISAVPLGASFISGFISTLIACERCLCITHPFKAKQILSTKITAVILLLSSVIILGFQFIVSAKYKIGCGYFPSLKATLTVFFASEFYQENRQLVDVLGVVVLGLFLPPFFVLTAVVTTAITVVKLKGAAKWRQTTAAAAPMESREIGLTKMLVAVSVLFIVCSIPNLIIKIVPLFVEGFRVGGRQQNILLLTAVTVSVLNAVNSSLNFFFYFKMGSKFRSTLKAMCACSDVKNPIR